MNTYDATTTHHVCPQHIAFQPLHRSVTLSSRYSAWMPRAEPDVVFIDWLHITQCLQWQHVPRNHVQDMGHLFTEPRAVDVLRSGSQVTESVPQT